MADFRASRGGPEGAAWTALGYVRATPGIEEERSIGYRKAIIEAYAAFHDLRLQGFLIDEEATGSASDIGPAMAQLLDHVENGPREFSMVVASGLSMMGDSSDELSSLVERLDKAGLTLVLIPEASRDEILFGWVAYFVGEWQREERSAAIRRGIQFRQERNRRAF